MSAPALRGADLRLYHRTLATSHTMKVTLQLLNLEQEIVAPITNRVRDGRIDVDADSQITRSLQLELADPRRTLNFDAYSPADGAMFADRMIRVLYGVHVPTIGWVTSRCFVGPLDTFSRQGAVVNVTAKGKELLALGQCFQAITVRKGEKKTDAIRIIMRERAGETKFAIPDLNARLPRDVSLGPEDSPWPAVQQIAGSMNRQLYYPGDGFLRLRPHPRQPSLTIRSGEGGLLLDDPEILYDISQVKNAVIVRGGKPRGIKKLTDDDPDTPKPKDLPIFRSKRVADRSHPLSPWALGRKLNDGTIVPRYLVEVIEDDTIRSQREADDVAERRLRQLLAAQLLVRAESWPVADLDPLDVIRLGTDDFATRMPLRQFSLPLVPGSMSLGYLRRNDATRKAIR